MRYECEECGQELESFENRYCCTFCGQDYCIDCLDEHEEECPDNDGSGDEFEDFDEDFGEDDDVDPFDESEET